MIKKIKLYKKGKETVWEDDMEEYALDKLGITIFPQGKHGEYTKDQIEFISEFTQWYFSDWQENFAYESGGIYYDSNDEQIIF